MKPGLVHVGKNGKGETIFEVHLWPRTMDFPYKACMSEAWEVFKDPRTFCREQATMCASALDPDDGAPSVVWDAANDCARRW